MITLQEQQNSFIQRDKLKKLLEQYNNSNNDISFKIIQDIEKELFAINNFLLKNNADCKFEPYQKKWFITLDKINEAWIVYPVRTGKTMSIAKWIICHATGIYPPDWEYEKWNKAIAGFIVVPSAAKFDDTIKGKFLELLHKDYVITWNKRSIEIKHRLGGVSKISFKSSNEKLQSFDSVTLDFCWFDEIPPFPIYQEITKRVTDTTGGNNPGKIITTAWCRYGGELYERFHEYKEEVEKDGEIFINKRIIPHWEISPRKTIYMNAINGWEEACPNILSMESIAELRRPLTHTQRQQQEYGIPMPGIGAIYPVNKEDFIIDRIPENNSEIPPAHWLHSNGMDFGWDTPTAVIFVAYNPQNQKYYIYDEYYQKYVYRQEHALKLREKGVHIIPTICDSAGKDEGEKYWEIYRNLGLNVIPVRKKIEKANRIITIRTLFYQKRLHVLSKCVHTINEILTYQNDEKGQIKKKINDHLMNALEYNIDYAATIGIPYTHYSEHYYNKIEDDYQPIIWKI